MTANHVILSIYLIHYRMVFFLKVCEFEKKMDSRFQALQNEIKDLKEIINNSDLKKRKKKNSNKVDVPRKIQVR